MNRGEVRASRVTIYTIARALGVSPSTVSRALSAPDLVSPATRERILEKAKELGYRPNAVARALITGTTRSIAVLVADITNPVFAALVSGMEAVCRSARYNLLLGSSQEDPRHEEDLFRLFLEKHVDGAIVASSRVAEARLHAWAREGIPLVLANRTPEDGRLSSVSVDNRRGGEIAARHLVERGARRLLYLAGPETSRASRLREQGWRATARSLGAEILGTSRGRPVAQGGREALTAWLESGQPVPDGIFAFNDLMAIGALQALRQRGLKVPEDVRVVGFDDIEMASLCDPPLTTVRQPLLEIGELAARLLIDAIERGEARVKTVLLEPELVVRQTS